MAHKSTANLNDVGLQALIKEAEKDGPLPSKVALYKKVAQLYNEQKPKDDLPLTHWRVQRLCMTHQPEMLTVAARPGTKQRTLRTTGTGDMYPVDDRDYPVDDRD